MFQVGLAEAKVAVENSGGLMVMAETFSSDQFKKSLQKLFARDEEGNLKMFFNASVEVMTTREVKICGAIGPCSSLQRKGMHLITSRCVTYNHRISG
jgi:protein transport protein SEC23